MLESAGYDAEYSLKPKAIHDIPPFETLGWNGDVTLRPTEPIVLDVGAAGKGYLVDIISEILAQHNFNEYTIDASGDIKQRGEPQTVGLEHPFDSSKVIGTAKLHDQSLCASSINRRAWQGMHHVFDPATNKPTETMLATWVVAGTTLLADALATALFFIPASELLQHFEFTYVTIDVNGAIDVSPSFDGELFT
jgi:thiamine biosynthesis lipoprotein